MTFPIFRFSTETILVDSIKKAEGQNRVLLRFHDYSGGRGEVKISSDLPIASWQECNLLEEVEGELNSTSEINLQVDPYEIKTLLIDFKISN
jgi:alpha-mannosidase